jgi:hypothetical protein
MFGPRRHHRLQRFQEGPHGGRAAQSAPIHGPYRDRRGRPSRCQLNEASAAQVVRDEPCRDERRAVGYRCSGADHDVDPFDYEVCQAILEPDIEMQPGMLSHELGEARQEQRLSEGYRQAHDEVAEQAARAAHLACFRDVAQDSDRAIIEVAAVARDGEPPRRAPHERDAQLLLECPELAAHVGKHVGRRGGTPW